MTVPLVGVSTYLEDAARWGVWELPAALLPAAYHRLVQRAGGLAALLPPDATPGAAAAVVGRLDALVIAGGPDVDPARYGAGRDPRTGPPAAARDAWELALLDAALAAGVPVLGVCRGMQLLNVARGGTLAQHLDGHSGPPGVFAAHRVTPVAGTLLGGLLGGPVDVPTYHHQAVDALGEGLIVSAHAVDGTVEAIEARDGFVLGVQWHPEAGTDVRVLRALVRAAADRAQARPGLLGAAASAAPSTAGASVSEGPYQVR
ncbi:gamma-glutamyl-gamma-aminobutyrate hydrolase family protein [Streptomyces sp. JJ66]|uniref:gamma-glutamyl-gamma-aminobutyrate hydrolase family protein n=1 Tax=Streptomyces sp. JJ66 TaxID=2803843 RepID=UPI001C56017B|nr:gamma-glutamyl-gamma-aminobutyrate hydrolase family protein [Streptomyces sp. JJ66]MBW1602139.1 gamma-glutamyl-gamma-aminobutyrate hydrolase family protein [Streptomyces sp. JJ66]